jgi:hypothetical protein
MWKQIEDFPNYEVSTEGQVRNMKTNRMLKPKIDFGYSKVVLYESSIRKHCRIHRLVATAFISNVEDKPQIDHIDRNKLNNHVSNLRWATNSENQLNRDYSTKEMPYIRINPSGSFQVRIFHFGKYIYVKTFKTKEEAILHRDEFMKNNPR